MRHLQLILIALLGAGCPGIIHHCGRCQAMGGAWLPETETCDHTCEEQTEGVICVEKTCPGDGATTRDATATCEECILLDGTWLEESDRCGETCEEGATCFTTRCPDD